MIYLILFVLCILPFVGYYPETRPKMYYWIWSCICIVVLSLFAGFRDFGVGYDTNMYIDLYFDVAKYANNFIQIFSSGDFEDYDRGYIALAWLGRLFSDNSQVLMLLTALFISSMMFIGIRVMRKNLQFSVALFLFFYFITFFNTSLNEMRQHCAMATSFVAFAFFLDKKFIPTVLLTIIAYTFHSSSLVFVECYLLYYILNSDVFKSKKILLLTIFGVQVMVIVFFYAILNFLGGFSISIMRDVYMSRYDIGADVSNTLSKHYIILFLFYSYVIFRMLKTKAFPMNNIYMLAVMVFCWFAYYSLSTNVIYLLRLSEYFQLIMILYLSYALSNKKLEIEKFMYIPVALYVWYIMYIVSNNSSTYPYSSSILGI